MPAPESGLPSQSDTSGEHGVFVPDGKHLAERKTLGGQKRLDSSYLLSTLSAWEDRRGTSEYSATTKGSSKVGGMGAVETKPLMKCSVESSLLSTIPQRLILSTQRMSLVEKTPQTVLPEEYTAAQSTCYPLSPSPAHSERSSLTHSSSQRIQARTAPTEFNQVSPRNLLSTVQVVEPKMGQEQSKTRSIMYTKNSDAALKVVRFSSSLPQETVARPLPYKSGLTPAPSQLRPHCLARDRLKLWFPMETRIARGVDGSFLTISEEDLQRVLAVMNLSWAPGTRECYGAGLLVFHVFCDERNIPEAQRCPIDTQTLLNFVSSCAGSYSGKTLANYVYAIKAWHTLHGQAWNIQQDELKAMLDGASELMPNSSKHSKREPFTVKFILEIRKHLNLSAPLDASVFACLTSTFYALCRTGELTVKSLKVFDSVKHVKRSNVEMDVEDRNERKVTRIFLPRMKVAVAGEEVCWAQQQDLSDPKNALLNHFSVNDPSQDSHLFAWRHKNGMRPLTRFEFWKRISGIVKRAKLGDLKGHGLRIGGTLEYLLRGVPFDVVKTMGRWSSEAFTIYLRKHALILAPYLQESQALEPFTRYTMPPTR